MVGLRWAFRDGLFAQGMETLAIGPFLVAYALQLGASNLMIGILAAIPHLAQFGQIPGVWVVERVRRRRLVTVLAAAASRPALLVIAAAALLPSPNVALAVIVGGFVARYLLGSIAGTAWNSWMRDFVPQDMMGRYFANRLMWMALVGVVISLAAAAFVDLWGAWWPQGSVYAFSILLIGAFGCGCGCVYCMARVPEPSMPAAGPRPRLGAMLVAPFRDVNFRRLILFLGSWNFAVNLAAPFFTVYMLRRLQLDLTLVIGLTVLSQFTNILVLRSWGRISDRFSNKSVLGVSAPLFVACIFAWIFTTLPERYVLTLPLLVAIHALTGVATAGVTLASGNIGLKLAPAGQGAAYLAASSLVTSLAAAVAPVLGGLFVDVFAARELSLTLRWASPATQIAFDAVSIRHWDFFFVFASILGLYSIHRLTLIRESGEVGDRIVLHELAIETRQGVRNLSSVAGLRAVGEFPLNLLFRAWRRRGVRRRTSGRGARSDDPPSGPTAPET